MLALACLALAGCVTPIGHEHVAGWPELTVYEHYVSDAEMHARCDKYTPAFRTPNACTEISLPLNRCDIWLPKEPLPRTLEHERLHCAGYDHPGSHAMEDALRAYVSGKR